MNEITLIDFASKVEALQAIHDVIPISVEHVIAQVGTAGVKAFFDGYRDSVELSLMAA